MGHEKHKTCRQPRGLSGCADICNGKPCVRLSVNRRQALLAASRRGFTAILRKAGIVSFAIGVIMFLANTYVFASLYHLAGYVVPQSQLASDFFSGAFYFRIGVILLI